MELTKEELAYLSGLTSKGAALYQVMESRIVALYSSPSLYLSLGMQKDEYERLIARDAADLVVPEDLPDLMKTVRECIRTSGQINHSWRLRHMERGSIEVHGTIGYCGEYDGHPVVLVIYGADGKADSYKEILDHIPVGVCVLFMPDREHQELEFVNKQMMRLISPDEKAPELVDPHTDPVRTAYYGNAFSGVHPDDLPRVMEVFSRGYDLRSFSLLPFRLKTTAGRYIWISLDVALHEIRPDGKVFYGVYRDVTVDVELHNELEDQRKQNLERTLIDTIGVLPVCSALYRMQDDGLLVPERYTDALCQLRGCTQENIREFDGEDGFASVHPDDWEIFREAFEGSRNDKDMHDVVYRIYTKDGAWKWVSASHVCFSLNDSRYLYIIYTDIDELKKREQKLREQYANAQTFLDSVASTYLMTRRSNLTQNRVEAVSGTLRMPRVEEIVDYDVLLEAFLKVMPREEDRREWARSFSRKALIDAFENGENTISKTWQVRMPNGEVSWVRSLTMLSKRPESGDIFAFTAVSNIDDEKRSEAIINQIVSDHFDFIAVLDIHKGTLECIRKADDIAFIEPGKAISYEVGLEYVRNHYLQDDQIERYDAISSLENISAAMRENGRHFAAISVPKAGEPSASRRTTRGSTRSAAKCS